MAKWAEGKIVEWNDDRGFGFATSPATDKRIFVHIREFGLRSQCRPEIGDLIRFNIQRDERGRERAVSISFIEKAPSSVAGVSGKFAVAILVAGAFAGLLAAAIHLGHLPSWIVCPYVGLAPVSGILYRMDKRAAQQGGWRISEKTLLGVDLAGGWIGSLFSQVALRHKTRKLSFLVPFWMIVGSHYAFCLLALSGSLALS